MARRSRVKSVRVEAVLKRMPDAIQDEVKVEIWRGAGELLGDMQARAANKSRRVTAALERRRRKKGLAADVGLATKTARRKAWFAHFIEFGTRPHSLAPRARLGTARRGRGAQHPGTPARPFIRPAILAFRPRFTRRQRRAVDRALARFTRGGVVR